LKRKREGGREWEWRRAKRKETGRRSIEKEEGGRKRM
jgi:hypothetical protein